MDAVFRLLSYCFNLRTSVPGLGERVAQLLAPFGSAGSRSAVHDFVVDRAEDAFEVRVDGNTAHRSNGLGTIVDWILWKASTEAIARIDDYVAIHAGAVVWAGESLLLPAPHDSGKTTLTAALVVAGFSYLSDEAALIDPSSGMLIPFPRALCLDPGSVAALDGLLANHETSDIARNGTSHIAPGNLRPGSIGRPSGIRHIVFPRYERDVPTVLTSMSRAEAVVELGRNSFNLDRFGRRAVDVLAGAVRGDDVHRLAVGDLGHAVEAISALAGKRTRVVPPERRARVV